MGSAILQKLSEQCGLTLATTHHADIKRMAEINSDFVNASMEFDSVSLKPTYRLLWGHAGESNALHIAHTLGFDPAVVEDAKNILEEEQGEFICAEYVV